MEIETIEQEAQHVIRYNVDLLSWYYKKNKQITNDVEKQNLFALMSYAFLEDHYCFMRILLYIANTRKSDEEEISYKIMVHFLSIMFPDIVFANLDMFLELGKKNDILYFLQCSNISNKILKFINHKAKEDPDFKILLTGKLIKEKKKSIIKYKPIESKTKWNDFLIKLLDEHLFNGITL